MSALQMQIGPHPKPGVVLGIGWNWQRPFALTWRPTGSGDLVAGSFGIGKVWLYYWWRK